MSLITEIRKKALITDAPTLIITANNKKRLISGKSVFVKDEITRELYMIMLNVDKIGNDDIDVNDLIIRKV